MGRRILIVVLAALALTIGGIGGYYWNDVRLARAETSVLVREAVAKYGRQVTLAAFPPRWLEILLKVEDPTFVRHRGVDLATPGAGMTTITQGLVKLIYFPNGFEQGIAKIRQTLIAEYALDALVTKDEQLELYFNMTYFGSVDGAPVHGFAAAAESYYGKPFLDLSDDEFIALVGMTIAPQNLRPGSPESATRVARIKRYLAGEASPASVLDFEYVGKARGSLAEEGLMALLRMLTHADPVSDGNDCDLANAESPDGCRRR